MDIQGSKITIAKSTKEAYQFLTSLKNFEQLMPDSIEKFEVDGNSFLFALKGMPEIRLVLDDCSEFSKISLKAASSKLSFSLNALLFEISDKSCDIQLLFEGDFNPMMTMMVKKPLTNFIDTLTQNIAKL